MTRRFKTVDVFTDCKFGGNQLAVVLEAEGLSQDEMQSIAKEFNYAESTFVFPPEDPANTAWVRIFTPVAEVPFAGHPNVGTAYVLARMGELFGKPLGDALVFEETAGLVRIAIKTSAGEIVGAELCAPKVWQTRDAPPAKEIAACVGLTGGELDTSRHPPFIAGAGIDFAIAEVTDRDALAAAWPDERAFAQFLPRSDAVGVYLYTPIETDGLDFQTRMFAPKFGVSEDAATGSAAVAFAGLQAHLAKASSGTFSYRIGQGYDLGRPSILEAGATKEGGSVGETRVGGPCVSVMEGTLLG